MDEYVAFSHHEAKLAEQLDRLPTLPRVVGFIVQNETSTHLFCRGCVAPDDPCFGSLTTIRENDAQSRTSCALCGRRLSEVTERAEMTGHGQLRMWAASQQSRAQRGRRAARGDIY